MKASKLIIELQKLIDIAGDLPVANVDDGMAYETVGIKISTDENDNDCILIW